jgi:hypothetical protein
MIDAAHIAVARVAVQPFGVARGHATATAAGASAVALAIEDQ